MALFTEEGTEWREWGRSRCEPRRLSRAQFFIFTTHTNTHVGTTFLYGNPGQKGTPTSDKTRGVRRSGTGPCM